MNQEMTPLFQALATRNRDVKLPLRPIRVLGIDLGTTNSTIADCRWDPQGGQPASVRCIEVEQATLEGIYTHLLVPSMVALHGGRVFVGEGAKRLRARAPALGLKQNETLFYECKNDIGIKRTYHRAATGFRSAADIGAKVLRFLYDAALTDDTTPVDHVVVTVPASFQANQRDDTRRAAEQAGIAVEGGDLLDEPMAAFIDYLARFGADFIQGQAERKLVVFDFGGGTCDVAVLSYGRRADGRFGVSPLAVSRYHRLGGGDIDVGILQEVLIPQIRKQNGLAEFDLSYEDRKLVLEPAFLGIAEALKIAICTEIERLRQFGRDATCDDVIARQPGAHSCRWREREITLQNPEISAAQFTQILAPFLDRDLLAPRETEYRLTCSIFAPLQDALDRAGLAPEQVQDCLMVGGSTLVPQVREALKEYFPRAKLLIFPDPDAIQTAVARGAAWHALSLELFRTGLVQPVAQESIGIRSEGGPVELVPRGAPLPWPADGTMAQSQRLAVPRTTLTESLDLSVQIVSGNDERLVMSRVWPILGPVSKGDPLELSYRMDENQVLHLRLSLANDSDRPPFEERVVNPLTNVVNPGSDRIKILEKEEALRSGQVAPECIPDELAEIGSLYAKIGQRAKALDIYKRALAGKGGVDPGILLSMGILAGEMGDHEREEKFYREAAQQSRWGAPWFNLALSFKSRGRTKDAIDAVEKAMAVERDAPYRVLRAMLAERSKDPKGRKRYLDEALELFNPLTAQSDWELHWYSTAARMANDKKREKAASAEGCRRRRDEMTESVTDGGELPIRMQGLEPA